MKTEESNAYPPVDDEFRHSGELAGARFLKACKTPSCETYIRALGCLKTQVFRALRQRGAEWTFSYSKRKFAARIVNASAGMSNVDEHYILEVREVREGTSYLILSVLIAIDLLTDNSEDARYLVGRGNAVNGSIKPIVHIIDDDTTCLNSLYSSKPNTSLKPNFHRFTRYSGDYEPVSVTPVPNSMSLDEVRNFPHIDLWRVQGIVNQVDSLQPTVVENFMDDYLDQKGIYFATLAALVDEAQAILIPALKRRFDLRSRNNVKSKRKENSSGSTRSKTKELKDSNKDQTPTSGGRRIPSQRQTRSDPAAHERQNKIDRTPNITPVFSGQLDRESISEIVTQFRKETGQSQRTTAELAGLDKNDVWRVESCEATIDVGLKVLKHLGFQVTTTIVLDQK